MANNYFNQLKMNNLKSDSKISRYVSKLFLTLGLVLFFSFNSFSQVATYRIMQTDLVNAGSNCGNGSWYGNGNVGFRWNDTLPVGAIIDSVIIDFNQGVDCAGGNFPTRLNNNVTGSVNTQNYCNCTVRDFVINDKPDPDHYNVRASNLYEVSATSLFGYCPNSQWSGAYAIVYVHYKTADIEALAVSPVTNFTSLCRKGEYLIDLRLRNNGPGPSGPIDILIEMDGAESVNYRLDASNLGVGQTRTYTIPEIIIPNDLGYGLELKATVLTPDLDPDNNDVSSFWDVLSTPFGADIMPVVGFPGFPRDGNRFNQDYITYNKSYVYEISSPSAYTNNRYNQDWTSSLTPLINGAPMPASKFTYTPPSGSNNARIQFELDEDDLNSEVQIRYNVVDISGNGCDSTTVRYAVVMPTPKPDFDGFSVCEVDDLQFVNRSTVASGVNSYFWDFGDGTSSTLFEPKKTFPGVGTYSVKLIATSNIGFQDSITVDVDVNPSPFVDFSFSNQCGNLPVEFVNQTNFSGGSNISYLWDFGDGQTSTEANPTIIYSTPGQYNVTLVAESDEGCANTVQKVSFSYPAPHADFSVPQQVCGGSDIHFQNNTTIAFSDWGSEWTFIDENRRTFTTSPTHMYRTFGHKEVKLRVVSQYGCVDSTSHIFEVIPGPAIDLTHTDACTGAPVRFNSNISVPQGMDVTYIWNIDGAILGVSNPSVQFNNIGRKNVSVQITYANGCQSTMVKEIETGYRPNASFDVPEVVCNGTAMTLSNTTQIEFGTARHIWNMGDGTQYTNVLSPEHQYANDEPTDYMVTLISSNRDGICPDTVSHWVRAGVTPVCDFDIDEVWIPGNRGFSFNPQQTANHGETFKWYFGDGRTSDLKNPEYQYLRDGNFPVRLVVNTPEGCQCSQTFNLNVVNASANQVFVDAQLTVYPNPSSGIFNLSHNGSLDIASVKVMDAVGNQVLNVPSNTQTLDLTTAANGVYFVSVTTAEGYVWNQKIMVAK